MTILKLALDEIQIPEYRQRTEFDGEALGELMASIQANGLLHPLVVRQGKEGAYSLVAGERRLRALSNGAILGDTFRFGGVDWPAGYAPAVSLGDLSQLEAESAELEENIRRVDLTTAERIAATGRIADLRRRQAAAVGAPVPRVADIALEVRGSAEGDAHETTRREIILSKHLDNPAIAKAKTVKEAWKILLGEEQTERNRALAQSVGATFTAAQHTILRADCVEWIRHQPAGQFDVILTDPPYGMGADSFGDAGGRLQRQVHEYADSPEVWQNLIGTLGAHWYRVAKEQAHLYLCCDIDGFHFAREWLRKVGWNVHRTPLINYKKDGSRVPWPENGPQRKWEMVLYAMKGNRQVTRIYPDVIETTGDENLSHGAQKPVAFFENLLRRSVRPGDSVLDTFAGTGTTVVAAHGMMCRATAVELDEASYGIMVKRVQDLK